MFGTLVNLIDQIIFKINKSYFSKYVVLSLFGSRIALFHCTDFISTVEGQARAI